ncbi:manganese and iron superoxide dismutase [Obba rivulosa]|uniref:Manganese and iron superoxide dismutase n=1 Tax=Obba rivulosa TaxID=1052685 RepID=A0A8E2DRB5_9APHY|nr:manganese and iron superoxide dismutase [Obba rivulosa]
MASIAFRLARNASASTRVASTAWSRAVRIPSRQLHIRKELAYPIEQGLGDFLSPEALKMLAVDYQEGLLDRLNELVKNHDGMRSMSVVQTVIDAARDPNRVLEFNYACEALNNSFFLESLKPPKAGGPSNEEELTNNSSPLSSEIRKEFASLEQFKSTFSAAVLGMFGPGWMWLVCDDKGRLAVYPTFGVGTLLVRSRQIQARLKYMVAIGEGVDGERKPASPASPPPTNPVGASSPASGVAHSSPPLHPSSPFRTFSHSVAAPSYGKSPTPGMYDEDVVPRQQDQHIVQTGKSLYPLFCVSVHERAWVGAGYGVWGKEEYMKRFWSVLDWKSVCETYSKFVPDLRFMTDNGSKVAPDQRFISPN